MHCHDATTGWNCLSHHANQPILCVHARRTGDESCHDRLCVEIPVSEFAPPRQPIPGAPGGDGQSDYCRSHDPVCGGGKYCLAFCRGKMGRRLFEMEARRAIRQGVTAVLDLTSEFSEPSSFRAVRYLNVPLLDLTAPTGAQFAEAVSFIKSEMARGTVYVHCKAGYSRSAAIIGGYLIEKGDCGNAFDAVALLRGKRPGVVVRDEVVSFLQTCTIQG